MQVKKGVTLPECNESSDRIFIKSVERPNFQLRSPLSGEILKKITVFPKTDFKNRKQELY